MNGEMSGAVTDAPDEEDRLFLSRLTLKRSPEIGPLIAVLRPADEPRAIATDHRLMWSAMPDGVQRRREADGNGAAFLWRRDHQPGRYYLLGPRPRLDSSLFEVEAKPFEAALTPGDRLRFVLRVNATVDRRTGRGKDQRERSDVAMDLLKSVPPREQAPGARAEKRQAVAAEAARSWLTRQAAQHGFALEELQLQGYRAALVERSPHKPGRIGVFDLSGLLTVREPHPFLLKLRQGFGRAKAFGCGLMLIRRAP
jgi:CRISPR system Cascade subunit CasE